VAERAIFIDKDGTLIENLPYNVDPHLIRLSAGAGKSLLALQEAGYRIVVISNQSGVARGMFTEEDLGPVVVQLRHLLGNAGVRLDGFYFCPHHPAGSIEKYAFACDCRKPQPGMIRQAAEDLGIDLASSWMIGDILDDVEAGHAAGCRSILIDDGKETEWIPGPLRTPDAKVPNLAAAADLILASDAQQERRGDAG
jgi:D-glycero-D-manno-heptose 1,7-bisphosphate phosphatase